MHSFEVTQLMTLVYSFSHVLFISIRDTVETLSRMNWTCRNRCAMTGFVIHREFSELLWKRRINLIAHLRVIRVDEALFESVENQQRNKQQERNTSIQLDYIAPDYLQTTRVTVHKTSTFRNVNECWMQTRDSATINSLHHRQQSI